MCEGLAVEVLEDEIRQTLVMPDVVQRADVGVIELRDCPRLSIESLLQLRFSSQEIRDDLDATTRSSRVSRAL
jgi:hypothetical protein